VWSAFGAKPDNKLLAASISAFDPDQTSHLMTEVMGRFYNLFTRELGILAIAVLAR
jgi:hypothetical protein